MCVTASSPTSKIKQVTMVFGRPLSNSSFAMLFLNNKNITQTVTCDATCMDNMLALQPKSDGPTHAMLIAQTVGTYRLEDVWSGNPVGDTLIKCTHTGCDPVTVSVPGYGGSTYIRLLLQSTTANNNM